MNRTATYVTALVLAHLPISIAHGLAHLELHVGLVLPDVIFVILVVLLLPLVAMVLVWTAEKRLGLILLTLSMSGSLLFGIYHHFMVMSPDHVRSMPPNAWGLTFVLTAYALSLAEAIGTYMGVHFLWTAKVSSNRVV